MADNVGYTPGTGATVAADDVGGVLFQRVKVTLGSDGTDDGDLSASNPLPVGGDFLTDAELRASAVPVAISNMETTLPDGAAPYLAVRQLDPVVFRTSFASVIANGVDSEYFSLLKTGTGQTVNQTNGALVLAAGTTANSETVIRSLSSFTGALIFKENTTLSQRIANNNFFIELVDVVGDGLAYTINSATSVTVTIPSNPFTSANVGQSMYLGVITGAAGISNRYAIASVSGNDVTFTVSGWPASGSGTLSLFGWNYYHIVYNGTGATAALFDAQRNGWASGDTTMTVATTATGHLVVVNSYGSGGQIEVLDQAVASATTLQGTPRASRVANVPDPDRQLYIQIRSVNGTGAPASNTNWTIGLVSVEDFTPNPVQISGIRTQGVASSLPVQVANTVTTTTTLAAATVLAGDVGQQYRATATGAATAAKVLATASTNATVVKASPGRLLGWSLNNNGAAVAYVKLHNIATTPTAGSTAVVWIIAIPPGGKSEYNMEGGVGFSTGIAFTTVTGAADANSTAVAADQITGAMFFA